MKKSLAVLAIIVGLVPALAQAQQMIQCPVETVQSSVTTSIPSPWWTTPQQGNLINTQVMMVGGQQTLMCNYWAYDKTVMVQRRAPEGMKCSANGKNFMCN